MSLSKTCGKKWVYRLRTRIILEIYQADEIGHRRFQTVCADEFLRFDAVVVGRVDGEGISGGGDGKGGSRRSPHGSRLKDPGECIEGGTLKKDAEIGGSRERVAGEEAVIGANGAYL